MELSENMQNYLIVIYEKEIKNQVARIKDISESLNVKHTSVIDAVKKLQADDIVAYEKRGFVKLTQKGRQVVQKIYKNKVIIDGFLLNVLNIPEVEIGDLSHKMEHFNSKTMINSLECLEYFFEKNPEIKVKYKEFSEKWSSVSKDIKLTLNDMAVNETIRVVDVVGEQQFRIRLSLMGITSGTELLVVNKTEETGVTEVSFKGYNLEFSHEEANNILVER